MSKGPMPPIDIEEDDLDPRKLTDRELDNVPHTVMKWRCCVKDCRRFTKVRDFGVWPFVYFRKDHWVNVYVQSLFCGRHWKLHNAAGQNAPLEFKTDAEQYLDLQAMKPDLTRPEVLKWFAEKFPELPEPPKL